MLELIKFAFNIKIPLKIPRGLPSMLCYNQQTGLVFHTLTKNLL